MPNTIYPMTEKDLAEVVALESEVFTWPWSERSFVEEMERGFSHILVARDKAGALLGFIIFWVLYDEMHILNLAVSPAARRQGVGLALAAESLRFARRRGCRTADLEVRESNDAAIQLYEKLGFAAVGRRRGYYESPVEDAVLMRLEGFGRISKKTP
ncbi:MAG: ribosomal protein S18-alanine N-acetyltransferase [Nitrospirae bacterium]|nr:ribosomal protein S18-alanine N-acetyltransferase [Nitrospirota bacterium]